MSHIIHAILLEFKSITRFLSIVYENPAMIPENSIRYNISTNKFPYFSIFEKNDFLDFEYSILQTSPSVSTIFSEIKRFLTFRF